MLEIFTPLNLVLLTLHAVFISTSASHAFFPSYGNGITCNCVCGARTSDKGEIVGGIEAQRNEFPWLVAITYGGNFHCGGSLITRRHVLTAAHCLKGFKKEKLTLLLGEHNLEMPTGEERFAEAAKYHEDYESDTFYNDIGIITMDEPVDFDKRIRPACLTSTENKEYGGKRGIVAGWGKIGYGMRTSDILQKVDVPVMSREECLNTGYTKEQIAPTMLCAGYPQGKKDACSGDSGGPLHIENRQGLLEVIGIVSWGEECAKANFPGVYTKVCDYLDWIIMQLDKDCLCAKP